MNAFIAIVQDTWRQSKQQIVFIVMLVLLLVLSLALIFIPKVYPESVGVLTSDGSGTFSVAGELGFDQTQAVALGDLDGDGDLDVVTGSRGRDRVWLNDGQASFSAGGVLADTDTRALAVADLDGDGDVDVVAAGAGADTVWLNDGQAKLTAGAQLSAQTSAAVALGDLDGDGDIDAVCGHAAGATVWLNDGKAGFSVGATVASGDVRAVALADCDGDGDLDLVVARALDGGNAIWLNDGKAGLSAGPELGKSNARALAAADFDGDGDVDVLVGNADGRRAQLTLNQGNGQWRPAGGYAFGYGEGGILALAVGDLNADGKPDVVAGSSAGGDNSVRLNQTAPNRGQLNQGPQFTRQTPIPGSELRALALGDLNGDQHLDVVGVFPQRDLGFAWSDEPSGVLSQVWIAFTAQSLMKQGAKQDRQAEGQAQLDAGMKAARQAQEVPAFQRAIEAWLVIGAKAIFTLSMVLFIVACSAYFPSLLAEGAVDVVLSRPVSRARIFTARYVGGLALFTAAILATYLLVLVGIGLRTGIWHGRLFLAAPLHIYAAVVVYAILGCVGVLFRSTTLAVILGLFFYLAVDTGIEFFLLAQSSGAFEAGTWPSTIADGLRTTLPNFGLLKNVANYSVLNVPSFDAQPLVVAGVWTVASLGIGYWKFRVTDY